MLKQFDIEEDKILPEEDRNNPVDSDRIVLPAKTFVDTFMQPQKRTRFKISGDAVFSFNLVFRIRHKELETICSQLSFNDYQDVVIRPGKRNSLLVLIWLKGLVEDYPLPDGTEKASMHSGAYLKVCKALDLVNRIYDEVMSIYMAGKGRK